MLWTFNLYEPSSINLVKHLFQDVISSIDIGRVTPVSINSCLSHELIEMAVAWPRTKSCSAQLRMLSRVILDIADVPLSKWRVTLPKCLWMLQRRSKYIHMCIGVAHLVSSLKHCRVKCRYRSLNIIGIQFPKFETNKGYVFWPFF
jgi:hypothetical protein